MEKILGILGIQGERISWNELENTLKKDVIKKTVVSVALLVLFVVYMFLYFSLPSLITGLVLVLAYCSVTLYTYLSYIYGQYATIEGDCVKINKSMSSMKVFLTKIDVFGASSVLLKTANGVTVEVPISHSKNILPGYNVIVYFKENNLFQKEVNYYKIISPIAVEITDTKNAKDKE